MTTTNVLRKLFKKLFNVDVDGNSTTAVLDDALTKDISIGGSGGGLMINYVIEDENDWGRCDKTCGEIADAMLSGIPCFIKTYTDNNQRTRITPITDINFRYDDYGFKSDHGYMFGYSRDDYPTLAD